MHDPFADAHLRVFQCYGCYLEMFKQADTVTKQEWHQVDVDFVEKSSVETLLHNRREATTTDLPPAITLLVQ